MKDKLEAIAYLHKIAPDRESLWIVIDTLTEAVSCYSEANRDAFFVEYACGYFRWLMAGYAPLTAEQMRSIGNGAPRIYDGFLFEIENVRPSLPIDPTSLLIT